MTKDQEQIFTIVRRVMKTSLSCFRHQNAARDRRTPPAGLVLLASLMALWGLVCMATSAARADEGMWTFDNPPAKQLQRYGFTPTQRVRPRSPRSRRKASKPPACAPT